MKVLNSWVPFIAGILCTYVFLNPSQNVIQQKTVYLIHCSDFQHNSFSCPVSLRVTTMEFLLLRERQIVVQNNLLPTTYKDCSIIDSNNWMCGEGKAAIGNGKFGFFYPNEGSLNKDGTHSVLPKMREISALSYYIRSAIEFFTGFVSILRMK
jgi:hypothetical protein